VVPVTESPAEQALAVARDLTAAGIPVFAAPPAPGTKVGFRLPSRWEQTAPDPEMVNQWQPGWALCMVCGHGLDGIDVDTYADGDLSALQVALGGQLPLVYGMAATPSGGTHLLTRSAGAASKNALLPGIDIKAGTAEGKGSGFLFIAPTVRTSKVTQLPGQYAWLDGGVDLERLRVPADDPGRAALAALLSAARRGARGLAANGLAGSNGKNPDDGTAAPGNTLGSVSPEWFMAQENARGSKPWNDIQKTLGAGRNDGIMRLAAALRETTSFTLDQALDHMYEHVWPLVDQHQGGHDFPQAEFEEVIAAVWRQYPGMGEKIADTVTRGEQVEEAVRQAASGAPPAPGSLKLPHDPLDLTDARLVQWVTWTLSGADGQDPYKWAPGLGWMHWRRTRWQQADTADVCEQVRQYFLWMMGSVLSQVQAGQAVVDQGFLAKLVGLQSRAKITAAVELSRGHASIRCDAADFDAHPDLLNTPGGIVDLHTGEIRPHDPKLMLTKITSGNYVPGYVHPDWEQALTALDGPEREWYQSRVGQAVTGHPPSDGIMPVLQGPGANGKTLLSTDGPGKALGDYADMASHKLIASQRAGSSEHSTEMADLRGQRLLIGEELSEGRSIDVTALKRIMDVGRIKARYVHKDNITFDASHSLFCTTNYRPVVSETDHGTWRRLALLVFRYTFRKPGDNLVTENDRTGDPELKARIRWNIGGSHDAIVTWAVQGAMRWYGRGMTDLPPTEQIVKDTRAWRAFADHVLSFWDELLEADHGAVEDTHVPCISASHLLAVFNAWLGQNGHTLWTKQTFAARFGEHEMTTSSGVGYRRTASLRNLSWHAGGSAQDPVNSPSAQLWVWVGVRFRKADDLRKESQLAEVAGSKVNLPYEDHSKNYPDIRQVQQAETGSSISDPFSAPFRASGTPPPLDTVRNQQAVTRPTLALTVDLETGGADELFTYQPHDGTGFVRLAGAIGPAGVPQIMSGAELLPFLDYADQIVGHNVLAFDLVALARHHSADYQRLAAKAVDTELVARQANPPRSRDSGSSLDRYDLDHVAEGLGVPGKTDSIAALKRKHGGYDRIPLDDPEYRSYLDGDLRATAAVARGLASWQRDPYVAREHKLAAIAGQMTLNGFRVDCELLERRQQETADRSRVALQRLHDVLGLPLSKTVLRGRGEARHEEEQELDSPLSSAGGREWLAGVWAEFGVADPPRTEKAKVLSVGADDLRAVARVHPELAGLCEMIITAAWPRTVYKTAADCLTSEGRVHPGNSFRQASGRWSVTNPGLTVFGKRDGRHVERDIFLPDEGHVLLSFDLSQVDMRSMAGHSQDPNYMAIFQAGRDAHQEIADQVGVSRQDAKAIGHGWNYGLGAKRMIANGLDPAKVYKFIEGMEQRFPALIAWREQIREAGKAGAILDNGFGRRMRCDPARAYTVAPALMGQGGARDIMGQSLLRLPRELDQYLRVMVHDEILLSIPRDIVLDVIPVVKEAMTWEWTPNTGGIPVPITCDFAFGASWGECSAH
jgi:P4 family phage/plasmid primase-like protien